MEGEYRGQSSSVLPNLLTSILLLDSQHWVLRCHLVTCSCPSRAACLLCLVPSLAGCQCVSSFSFLLNLMFPAGPEVIACFALNYAAASRGRIKLYQLGLPALCFALYGKGKQWLGSAAQGVCLQSVCLVCCLSDLFATCAPGK